MRSIPKRMHLPALDASEPAQFEIFLTPGELTERWRLHEGTLRNWRFKRKGPAYTKLADGSVLYPLTAVLKYERENTVTVHKQTRPMCDPADLVKRGNPATSST